MSARARPERARNVLALIMIAGMFVWPLVHMILTSSRETGWSPWRLMGFGMFSETVPYRTHIGLVLIARGERLGPVDRPAAGMDVAEYLGFTMWQGARGGKEPLDVVRFEGGRAQLIPREALAGFLGRAPAGHALPKFAIAAGFHRNVTDVQTMYNNRGYMSALVESILRAEVARRDSVDRVAIFITKPRLHMRARYHFGETCVFVWSRGDVEPEGCFSGAGEGRTASVLTSLGL